MHMLAGILIALAATVGLAVSLLPGIGAGALLHPSRRAMTAPTPASCVEETFEGAGVRLGGWRCRTTARRRGTLVYLHGVADNRAGAAGVVQRFGARGFDVVAYDSRAHGDSSGEACTYGFYEKRDLARVLDTLPPGPVVLLGTSLGAAVALQTAALDSRVSAVVAAETFSDLRTVAAERAPLVIKAGSFGRALRLAERQGAFVVNDVSPVAAAPSITVPVFLAHGDADTDTPPEHSRRVFAALTSAKHLEIVPGAGHNGALQLRVWDQVERWLDDVMARPAAPFRTLTPQRLSVYSTSRRARRIV